MRRSPLVVIRRTSLSQALPTKSGPDSVACSEGVYRRMASRRCPNGEVSCRTTVRSCGSQCCRVQFWDGGDGEGEIRVSGKSLDNGAGLTGGTVVVFLTIGVVLLAGLLAFSAWKSVAEEEETRAEQAAWEAAEKSRRIVALGAEYAAVVESVLAAVKRLRASEAARTGWLGDDFDFTVDIRAITDNF